MPSTDFPSCLGISPCKTHDFHAYTRRIFRERRIRQRRNPALDQSDFDVTCRLIPSLPSFARGFGGQATQLLKDPAEPWRSRASDPALRRRPCLSLNLPPDRWLGDFHPLSRAPCRAHTAAFTRAVYRVAVQRFVRQYSLDCHQRWGGPIR